ncbi:hypothetical protein [Abditibacterium utsteinense]|uniref:hypothetical protein n=1 Tax=Abditibacterium utsteinense TaxID=1960156 RepID=UPI000CFD3979|nr:hypothetical protein [Abditibacterium utsteinense]
MRPLALDVGGLKLSNWEAARCIFWKIETRAGSANQRNLSRKPKHLDANLATLGAVQRKQSYQHYVLRIDELTIELPMSPEVDPSPQKTSKNF